MDLILIEAAKLGGVSLLACFIFIMYRLDRRSSEKRLTGLLQADQESREEHTKALTELLVVLRRLNGRAK